MIPCPLCNFENIEGVDVCEQCGQPLDDLHLPDPKNAVERGLLRDTVEVLGPKTPVVVTSDAQVGAVLQLLVERDIGCVFVVDNKRDNHILGVFTERDALMRLGTQAESLKGMPICEFMTANPQSLRPHDRVAFAVHRMDLGGYRHIPIVDGASRVQGVISVRDILGYLTDRMRAGASA